MAMIFGQVLVFCQSKKPCTLIVQVVHQAAVEHKEQRKYEWP
jgi:hypothetical protein